MASTNLLVKEGIDAGAAEGLAVLAFQQTAGYGRQGRGWVSPPGGMYLSFLLRPAVRADELPSVSLVVGLAVREAVEGWLTSDQLRRAVGWKPCCGTDRQPPAPADLLPEVSVKWPNDIMLGEGKVAGVSLELHRGAICVGVGANVLRNMTAAEVQGKYASAFLSDALAGRCDPLLTRDAQTLSADQRCAIEGLAQVVLACLEPRYRAWRQRGFAACAAEYRSRQFLTDRWVRMVNLDGDVIVEGVSEGVDERGSLLVRTAEGLRAVSSGEAHVQRTRQRP
ncbi:biotin--[acetyl-CoA-carboxylase] ligase [Berryella wangjianweii]|uniref:biotin--[biotin carboxyl-carrier protein] ligase n=1 Tax=Berryella wangjianweii TaxID=2734634 RepID=A0A6M8J5H0_9ACTN|nr:biotin--[acetyl-CoA-carboxylase] ligase [Berryella wangjianweii]QKF07863.1 biotin--[acetyl-CoA-carboxylase] ligase [Berryella wangjianweii]